MDLYPLGLGLTRAFALKDRRCVLVDAGSKGDEVRILAKLAALVIDPTDVSLILITHAHMDHCGGLAALREHIPAPVAIHRAEAGLLSQGCSAELEPARRLARLLTRFASRGSAYRPAEPDIIIRESLDLEPYGVCARALWTPGHTPGSLSVHMASGQALVGDLLMGGWIRRRRPSFPFLASDLAQVRESIMRILALQPKAIHAAHGGPFTPQAAAALLQ